MKTLLIACSTAALIAASASAAEAQDATDDPAMTANDQGRQAENYTEDHPWVGLPVRGMDDDRIGSVSHVRLEDGADMSGSMSAEADTEVEALVLETGGFLGVGGREVEVDASQARLEVEDEEEYVRLSMDEDDVEALPEVDTDAIEEDDGWFDGENNNDDMLNDDEQTDDRDPYR